MENPTSRHKASPWFLSLCPTGLEPVSSGGNIRQTVSKDNFPEDNKKGG